MQKKYQPLGTGMVPSMTEAGRFLRSRRLDLGLSQVECARRAGLKQRAYSSLERGRYNPQNQRTVDGLAQALHCDPSELKALIPPKKESQTALGNLIRSRRQELGLSFAHLAEKASMHEGHLRTVEIGTRERISRKTAQNLAQALALDASVFQEFIYIPGRLGEKDTHSPLGAAVRARRKELGMDAREVAALLQVSKQTVSQIELGNTSLHDDCTLMRLAAVLKIDPEHLRKLRPERKNKARGKKARPVGEARKLGGQPGMRIQSITVLGGFLAGRRTELELSRVALAVKTGISPLRIFRLESGRAKRPHALELEKFAGALECEATRLYELIPNYSARGSSVSSRGRGSSVGADFAVRRF